MPLEKKYFIYFSNKIFEIKFRNTNGFIPYIEINEIIWFEMKRKYGIFLYEASFSRKSCLNIF